MTDLQERSDLIRVRLRNDLVVTLRQHLGLMFAPSGELLDALTEDAMHPVEKLLADVHEHAYHAVPATGNMYHCADCGSVGWAT